jgi:hypothetical protein
MFVRAALVCRHYLQRWARHAHSKQQRRQQLTAAAQLHRQCLCASILATWRAAAAAGAGLRQRLQAWQQHKRLAMFRAWGAVAAVRQQQWQLVKQVRAWKCLGVCCAAAPTCCMHYA